ncbi:MAG: AraC family transcriptional regulator [Rhodocyclales bacterium GT-UBC]|nr:MAG: AraC family transcriptional regulator [Rhodocyclales bacterium GT-UBC]
MSSRLPRRPQPADCQSFWRDPALPYVESRRAIHSRACYIPHHHPTVSIGVVDAGRSLFTGAGNREVELSAGTLVIIPADCVHACNPAPDAAWSYQMLHLDAAWFAAVRREYAADWPSEDEAVRIVKKQQSYARFCRLNALLFGETDAADKETALIEFIGDHDGAPGHPIPKPAVPSDLAARIRPALDYIRSAPTECIPLAALADLARLSRYQLIRAFRSVTGLTPHAWQLNQRINLARQRLGRGEQLAELALALGFADQAHFQRAFKAHTGVSPGLFRR